MKDIKQSTEEVKRRIKSMGVVKLTVLALMIAGTVCSFVFNDYIFPADSVFNRGISDSEFINDISCSRRRVSPRSTARSTKTNAK